MSWLLYILMAGVLCVIFFVYMSRARRKTNTNNKSSMDRTDPKKYWAQAAIALYRGDVGDPGYWGENKARKMIQGSWSTPDGKALIELIDSYIQGECNVAFDKLRIIWLARLGYGAGWIDEAKSWAYVFQAVTDLQNAYGSWQELQTACAAGREEWYGGADEVPKAQLESASENYAFASQRFFSQVPFR